MENHISEKYMLQCCFEMSTSEMPHCALSLSLLLLVSLLLSVASAESRVVAEADAAGGRLLFSASIISIVKKQLQIDNTLHWGIGKYSVLLFLKSILICFHPHIFS